jgi:uncharacterized RDD family membrane protein YckC
MDWYYAAEGMKSGPVSDAVLAELARTGVVRAETLVWNSGLPGWIPYGQALAMAPSPPPLPGPEAGGAAAAMAGFAFCSECGRPFSPSDLVRFGDHSICGNCKEIFAQKLREGVALRGAMEYGGFWIRFAAVCIDGAILFVISMLTNRIMVAASSPSDVGAAMAIAGVLFLIQVAIAATYEGVFVGQFGATPGKMALRLKVVMADGSPVSTPRAFGRYFAKQLSLLTLLIGYIIAGFDEEKRALHDHICGTRVIRNPG